MRVSALAQRPADIRREDGAAPGEESHYLDIVLSLYSDSAVQQRGLQYLGPVERGPVVPVHRVEPGAAAHQELHHRCVAVAGSSDQGSLSVLHWGLVMTLVGLTDRSSCSVELCPELHQGDHGGEEAPGGGHQQRRHPVPAVVDYFSISLHPLCCTWRTGKGRPRPPPAISPHLPGPS